MDCGPLAHPSGLARPHRCHQGREIQLGLGADIGGLTSAQARRVVADIGAHVDVVALTIAEYIPRQVIQLQQLLAGFPLL